MAEHGVGMVFRRCGKREETTGKPFTISHLFKSTDASHEFNPALARVRRAFINLFYQGDPLFGFFIFQLKAAHDRAAALAARLPAVNMVLAAIGGRTALHITKGNVQMFTPAGGVFSQVARPEAGIHHLADRRCVSIPRRRLATG
ncbi:hypothetical protein D3C80_1752030 [compost metagenome]